MKTIFFACLFATAVSLTQIAAQTKVSHIPVSSGKSNKTTQFFPLSELKRGMRGQAQTVFQGSEPTPFDVEILGVVPGAIGPKYDMIVGRISGGGADRTHVFAGMSGSPVYIDGKLVGAIAYAFPFSKEAICGITPIKQMIEIFEKEQNRAKPKTPKSYSFSELVSSNWKPSFPSEATVENSYLIDSSIQTIAGQGFRPIATPVTFSGISQATLDKFARQLREVGLEPISAAGARSKITPIKKADSKTLLGGDSVTMQLARGDYSAAAAGTVTLRDGDKIYAFGHPFLSLGSSNLPMSESHVVTVVPSVNNSFKLSVPDALVGSMTQDRKTGVFGKLGKVPRMIPVKVHSTTSSGQLKDFDFEIANDAFLSPILINLSIYDLITSTERILGDTMVGIEGKINLKGNDSVIIKRRFAGSAASQLAAFSAAGPLGTLLQSRFDDLEIESIELNVDSTENVKTAVLDRIGVSANEVKAGEKFNIKAFIRTDTGRIFTQSIPVKIPNDTPEGLLTVTIGDGGSLQFTSTSTKFVPKNINELVRKLNEVKYNDRLYVQTHRITKGAVIGSSELPNLPPSVLATINNTRTVGGVTPTLQSLLTEQEIPPSEFLINGRKSIAIRVDK